MSVQISIYGFELPDKVQDLKLEPDLEASLFLFETCRRLWLPLDVYFMAHNVFDRLRAKKLQMKPLVLAALSLQISSKFHDGDFADEHNFRFYEPFDLSKKKWRELEFDVLKRINFELNFPTLYEYIVMTVVADRQLFQKQDLVFYFGILTSMFYRRSPLKQAEFVFGCLSHQIGFRVKYPLDFQSPLLTFRERESLSLKKADVLSNKKKKNSIDKLTTAIRQQKQLIRHDRRLLFKFENMLRLWV